MRDGLYKIGVFKWNIAMFESCCALNNTDNGSNTQKDALHDTNIYLAEEIVLC